MKIRSLLATIKYASIAMILLILAILVYTTVAINRMNAALAFAGKIRINLTERIIVREEFFLRQEAAVRLRLMAKSDLIANLQNQALEMFQASEDQEILLEMIGIETQMRSIFQKLIDIGMGPRASNAESRQAEEYGKMLFSQLLIKSYILHDDARRLEEKRFRELVTLRNRSNWLLSAAMGLVVILVQINGFLIERMLSKGINKLKTGASRIGGGDLAYRLLVDSRDEISEIAEEINRMASALMGSLTSIDKLELEASRRQLAEEQFRSLNTELEDRIAMRTAQLESSNKELEAFAYSVAHDLRAPLRSIDGFANILQTDYVKDLDTEGLRLFGVIRTNAQKLDKLIAALLEVARIGKIDLVYTRVDMRGLAKEAFHTCGESEMVTDFDFVVQDLPFVMADAVLMSRVWSNLIANAMKYSMPCPAHKIEISARSVDGMFVYSIRDYGVGFDQQYVDKLFGLFQRLHGSEEFSGSGIGLSIVKKVIERHGGTVWGEGHLGAGATFYFSVPAVRSQE